MRKVYLFVLLMAMFGYLFGQSAEFSNSLHKTRFGKFYWYAADTDSSGAPVAGFESLTEIPIDSMGCIQCHGPADANGDPYDDDYEPTCTDCHKSDFSVEADQCYSCHGRQKAEAIAMGCPMSTAKREWSAGIATAAVKNTAQTISRTLTISTGMAMSIHPCSPMAQ
jgi:hypothetical protein